MSDVDPIDLGALERLVRGDPPRMVWPIGEPCSRVSIEVILRLIADSRRLQKAREAWVRLGPSAPLRVLHRYSCAALNGRPLVYTLPCDCGVDALRAALEGP